MKILYLHQYFRTPDEGGAIRSYYLAKNLVEKGYEVEVVSSHNGREDKTEVVDGITVHYLSVYYDNKLGFAGRVCSFLKFVVKAYRRSRAIPGIDLCFATSTPLTVGLISLRLKKKFNIPYYFEVRDLWPEAPVQMGAIKNGLLKKALYSLEKKIYQNAQKLIALSPGIRDGIEKSVGNEKPVYILPNISDCEFFHPEAKDPVLETKFDVKGKFVVSYFGAIGKVNHLEFMLEAIKACEQKGIRDVRFLIAGKGSEDVRIRRMAEEMGLKNVSFLGFVNKEGVREMLNVTDAAYISFADLPILQTNSPNKFFDAIAAGKLCIVNSQGWIKEMIEQKECGFYANPHSPAEFAEKLLPFVEDKSKLLLYQTNARKLAETYFSRAILTERFSRLFSKEEKIEPISPSVYTLTA